jgi:hypothetical protein
MDSYANCVDQMEKAERGAKNLPSSSASLYRHTLSKLRELRQRSQDPYELHA